MALVYQDRRLRRSGAYPEDFWRFKAKGAPVFLKRKVLKC